MEFTVLVVGEASVGKTALVNKLGDAAYVVEPSQNPDYDYWHNQVEATQDSKTLNVNGKSVTLKLLEIQGSRGRMSNYYDFQIQAPKADCVIFCYSAKMDWSLTTFDHTMNLIRNARQKQTQTAPPPRRKSLFSKKSTAVKKQVLTPTDPKGPLPTTFLIQTKSEGVAKETTEFGAKYAADRDVLFFAVSALENSQVQETFQTIAERMVLGEEARKLEKEREKKAQKEQEEKDKAAAAAVAAAAKQEKPAPKQDIAGIWSKLMDKFTKKGAKDQQEPSSQLVKANEATVDQNDSPGEIAPVA